MNGFFITYFFYFFFNFFIYNKNQSLNSEHKIYSSDNLRYVSKIQANFPVYIFRKKILNYLQIITQLVTHFYTDLSKQVKENPIKYSIEVQENNPKILQLKNLLPKF